MVPSARGVPQGSKRIGGPLLGTGIRNGASCSSTCPGTRAHRPRPAVRGPRRTGSGQAGRGCGAGSHDLSEVGKGGSCGAGSGSAVGVRTGGGGTRQTAGQLGQAGGSTEALRLGDILSICSGSHSDYKGLLPTLRSSNEDITNSALRTCLFMRNAKQIFKTARQATALRPEAPLSEIRQASEAGRTDGRTAPVRRARLPLHMPSEHAWGFAGSPGRHRPSSGPAPPTGPPSGAPRPTGCSWGPGVSPGASRGTARRAHVCHAWCRPPPPIALNTYVSPLTQLFTVILSPKCCT